MVEEDQDGRLEVGKEKKRLNEVGGEQRKGSGENKKLEVASCLFQILVNQFNINGQAARKSQLEEPEKQALCPQESRMSQTVRWEIYYEETNCAVFLSLVFLKPLAWQENVGSAVSSGCFGNVPCCFETQCLLAMNQLAPGPCPQGEVYSLTLQILPSSSPRKMKISQVAESRREIGASLH